MTRSEKAALKKDALERLERLLDERIDEQSMTLDEIEAVVEEVGRDMDAWLEEQLIQRQAPSPENQATCPHCGHAARFRRLLRTLILTSHGLRAILRRYHYCEHCRKGFSPIDAVLGLEEGRDATRQVRAWQAKYASEGSFAAVPDLLRDLRGVEVSESTVERTTIEIGEALYNEAKRRTAAEPVGEDGVTVNRGWTPERLYLSMDGTFCPLREPWRRDGSLGKLVCRYGEVKLGMVFETYRKDGLDTEVRSRACTATLGDIEEFRPLLLGLAREWGAHRVPELAVLGDGAPWIWCLAEKHFPDAVQILDYRHMTEHLYSVARAMFELEPQKVHDWVRVSQWYMERDLSGMVVDRIEAWEPTTEEHRAIREREIGYFEDNAERMRYKTFLKHGYMIGSGVIEAGCKHVIGQRVDQSGMHWRPQIAQAVLAVRCYLKTTGATDLRAYA